MLSALYWIVIGLATGSFSLINIFSKAVFNGKSRFVSFKSFLPVYLSLSSVFVVITTLFLVHSVYIPLNLLAYAAVTGFLYFCAAYLVFFSLDNEKASLIGTINGSQFILLSFLSALFFVPSLIFRDAAASLIMLAGVLLLSLVSIKGLKISKFVLLALIGNISWVVMWLFFYKTLPSNVSAFAYYSWLSIFAALFSILLSLFIRVDIKSIKYYLRTGRIFSFISLASLMNGFGTAMYSLAFTMNSAYSPLISEISIPALIVISMIFLKERLKINQMIGAILMIFAVVFLFL
ncbi:MAG: DMT family transporter [Candidatus Parvarchaeota archaeon]